MRIKSSSEVCLLKAWALNAEHLFIWGPGKGVDRKISSEGGQWKKEGRKIAPLSLPLFY